MADSSLSQHLANRIRTLRSRHGWTLDVLARRSEVSRSAISLIERAESSPTAAVLDRIAAALGVTLSGLLADDDESGPTRVKGGLHPAGAQPVWTDPASGYRRRSLSPPGQAEGLQLVEIHFPSGARVVYDHALRSPLLEQQVWLLAGEMEVTAGSTTHRLSAGDCLAMPLDGPTGFHNPGSVMARYLVAIAPVPTPMGARHAPNVRTAEVA